MSTRALIPTIRAVACLKPFSTERVDRRLPAIGYSIEEILARMGAGRPGADCHVAVDGNPVPLDEWSSTKPEPGETLAIRVFPAGGDRGKDVLRVVGYLAAVAGAWYAAPVTAAALGLGVGAVNFVQAGLFAAGAYAVRHLIPTPRPGELGRGAISSVHIQNTLSPYAAIPKFYGTHRSYPAHATQPWYDGTQKCALYLFLGAYGRLSIDEASLKIEDTPIVNFPKIEYEIREGYEGEAARTIFPPMIREQVLDIDLVIDEWVEVGSTEPETDEFILEVTFPNGIGAICARGGWGALFIPMRFQIRLAGSDEWQEIEAIGLPWLSTHGFHGASGVRQVHGLRFMLTGEFPNAPGQFDLRVRQLPRNEGLLPEAECGAGGVATYCEDAVVTGLRSQHWVDPIAIDKGDHPTYVATIGLRVPADDARNGIINGFNFVGQSVVPDWTGSEWVERATNSPAAAYRDALQGSANKRPLADARVDLTALAAWSEDCEENGWEFNGIFDRGDTLFRALTVIAARGRAAYAMAEGKYSVIQDKPRTTIIQHFTPRNSWGFTGRKAFPPEIHGLKVQYIDASRDWQHAECLVYADGYDETNATKFEKLELFGCTSEAQAVDEAGYYLNVIKLRPETFTLNVDIEYLVCTRADLVRVTHDVPMIGLHVGRIKQVILETEYGDNPGDCVAIKLDEQVQIVFGYSYSVRIRLSDGSSVGPKQVSASPGWQTILNFVTPIPAGSDDMPSVGDLVLFGETGSESGEYIVTQIEPREDFNATLTLVEHAPGVHSSEPQYYNPVITIPPNLERRAPATPIIEEIQTDETVLFRAPDDSLESRIVIVLRIPTGHVPVEGDPVFYPPPNTIEVQYRLHIPIPEGDPPRWEKMTAFPGDSPFVYVAPVDDGAVYDVRVRAISEHHVPSDWAQQDAIEVIGKISLPADVTEVYCEQQGRVLRWTYDDPPLDLDGFRVRYQWGDSEIWAAALPAHDGLLKETSFNLGALPVGVLKLLVKAVDTSGNESANAVATDVAIGAGDLDHIFHNFSHKDESWDPTGCGATIIEGEIEAGTGYLVGEVLEGIPFWPEDGSALFWDPVGTNPFWPGAGTEMYGPVEYTYHISTRTSLPTPPNDTKVRPTYLFDFDGQIAKVTYLDAYVAHILDNPRYLPWPGQSQLSIWGGYFWTQTLLIKMAGGVVRPKLKDITEILDAIWQREVFSDVVVTETGDMTTLPITKTYAAIKSVTGTFLDTSDAVSLRIHSMAATGPVIFGVDENGVRKGGTLSSVEIKGY